MLSTCCVLALILRVEHTPENQAEQIPATLSFHPPGKTYNKQRSTQNRIPGGQRTGLPSFSFHEEIYFSLSLCVSVSLYAICVCGTWWKPEKALDPLELESQVVVKWLVSVQRTKLVSSARAEKVLIYWAISLISPALRTTFFNTPGHRTLFSVNWIFFIFFKRQKSCILTLFQYNWIATASTTVLVHCFLLLQWVTFRHVKG